MTRPAARTPVIVLSALVLWALLAAATYAGWIRGTDHRDFYPRWAGARLALFEGRDLYSVETTRDMQLMLYGQVLPPERDQQAFAYPAILVPLLLPFWFIPNVEIATALWEATSILLMLGVLLLVRTTISRVPRWLVVLLMLWYYPTLMVFQAQITALPLAALGVGWWAYHTRRDALTGAILVIGFVKPEQVIVPVLVLLALAVHERRWRVLTGFAASGVALFLASMLVNGWWIPRWLDAVQRYAAYAQTSWSPGTAWAISPLAAVALAALLVVVALRTRWTAHSAFAASIPLGALLIPQTLIWGLTMLVLPLVLSWRGRARWGVVAVWALGWLFVLGSGIEGWWRVQSLVLPALTLGVTAYASRQQGGYNRHDHET